MRDHDVVKIGNIELTFRAKLHGEETVGTSSGLSAQLASSVRMARVREAPRLSGKASTETPRPAANEKNLYEILGVPNFETDSSKIQSAAKERLRRLRGDKLLLDGRQRQAEVEAVSSAVLRLMSQEEKLQYDIRLAQAMGYDYEVYNGRVVAREPANMWQVMIALACVCVAGWALWIAFSWLYDSAWPYLQPQSIQRDSVW
jgi:hypothetical protein